MTKLLSALVAAVFAVAALTPVAIAQTTKGEAKAEEKKSEKSKGDEKKAEKSKADEKKK